MESARTYGLTIWRAPPWWVRRVPFLRRLWLNPLFQRNYARSRIRKIIENHTAFWFGIIYSTIVSGLFLLVPDPDDRLNLGAIISVLVPVGSMLVIAYIRMFLLCLSTTPVELRRDVTENELSPVFTTPLPDRDIYFGECLANFVKGLQIIDALVYLMAGALIPYLSLIVVPYVFSGSVDLEILLVAVFAVPMAVFFLLAGLVLMMLLLSLASGVYAISLPAFPAILITLIHYAVVSMFAYLLGGQFTAFGVRSDIMMASSLGMETPMMLAVGSFGLLVKTGTVLIACNWTALMGISAFARTRRRGYYEPEMSTAAGLEFS